MELQRYSLCPNCDSCPEVVVSDEEVSIGEPGNLVRLSSNEWNVLVGAIKAGEIAKVGVETSEAGRCDCGCDCC